MCALLQPGGVVNADGWSWTASPSPWSPDALAARGVSGDVASVAGMWVVAAYDDLRRAGPDRAARVRQVLDGRVLPCSPLGRAQSATSEVMVHEWLLTLVGRRPVDPEQNEGRPVLVARSGAGRERSLREAAKATGVSLATARRRWHDGELPGAYRDSRGYVRVPEPAIDITREARLAEGALATGCRGRAMGASPAPGLSSGQRDRATGFRPDRGVGGPEPGCGSGSCATTDGTAAAVNVP